MPVKDKKSDFSLPAAGGALQNMKKDKDGNIELKLTEKITISEDTFIFRFGLGKKEVFGLPIGKHVIFSADVPTKDAPKGELCCRKYTPISEITREGYIDFLIKIYKAGVVPRFPDGGVMTQHIDRMKIGDTMLMEGPKGRL